MIIKVKIPKHKIPLPTAFKMSEFVTALLNFKILFLKINAKINGRTIKNPYP